MRAARIAHLFCLRPIKFSIYGVVIAVSVVDAKEDDTDLFINACRTGSMLIFPHSTCQILLKFGAQSLPFTFADAKAPNKFEYFSLSFGRLL